MPHGLDEEAWGSIPSLQAKIEELADEKASLRHQLTEHEEREARIKAAAESSDQVSSSPRRA